MPAEKNCVMRAQNIHHALRHGETIDTVALGKYRYAVCKEPGLSIERNQPVIEQADENRIARVTVNHAANVLPAMVNRRVDRCLRGNGPFTGNAFTLEVYCTNIFWTGQHPGEPGIYEKSLCSGDPRAQMTRPGKHSFTGNDLQTLDEPLFQVLDFRLWILDFRLL